MKAQNGREREEKKGKRRESKRRKTRKVRVATWNGGKLQEKLIWESKKIESSG